MFIQMLCMLLNVACLAISLTARCASFCRCTREQLLAGFEALEVLLPGFYPCRDKLQAAQWAQLVTDIPSVAARIVALKVWYLPSCRIDTGAYSCTPIYLRLLG